MMVSHVFHSVRQSLKEMQRMTRDCRTPAFTWGPGLKFRIEGLLGDYIRKVTDQWLIPAPDANPGMLEMFADRDRRPYRDLVAWAGEFAGKYLTGAVEMMRLNPDDRLRSCLDRFVQNLLSLQDKDGYLGPWPREARLTNRVVYPDGKEHYVWDTWGHYHLMLGLLLWYGETGDTGALRAVRRIGDRLCEMYLGEGKPRLADGQNSEMNFAPAHSLCLLHRLTGHRPYLDLARHIVDVEFSLIEKGRWPCGNYLKGPLEGRLFFELPKPRWEGLHPILAMAELYYLTGERKYRTAFERIWRSIAHLDRHNNGGFSSGERANGNPFDRGGIETCCTIAWTALTVEMLRMTGDPLVADELELTLFNSIVGMHSPSGRWATYNTPMDGVRRVSYFENSFQIREGTPELNCCSVNSARGFGLLSEWAVMRREGAILLNAYFPGAIQIPVSSGEILTLRKETDYPREGKIRLSFETAGKTDISLWLRIPRWSRETTIRVNGRSQGRAEPGTYFQMERSWQNGDQVEIELDMRPHFWKGEEECAEHISLYRGPILLTYDRRFNAMDPDQLPAVDPRAIRLKPIPWRGRSRPPFYLAALRTPSGKTLHLCDFGSAGEGGSPYRSWLPVVSLPDQPSLFQPFAPDPRHMEMARLVRFKRLAEEVNSRLQEPWKVALRSEETLGQLDRLQQLRPYVLKAWSNLSNAAQNECDPEKKDLFASLFSRLGDFETRLNETEPGRLERKRDEIRALARGVLTLWSYEVSPLLTVRRSIEKTNLPPKGVEFQSGSVLPSNGLWDIRSVHGGKDGLLYLRSEYHSPRFGKGWLLFGADGPVKVWVNGREVGCHPEAVNPAVPGEYQAEVKWRKGANSIYFALRTNQGRAWGIFAAVFSGFPGLKPVADNRPQG